MDYDEAFNFTRKYIKRWYDYLGYSNVDYDDYAQNCAVSFFTDKKNNIDSEECIYRAEKEYFNILVKMANDEMLRSKLNFGFVDDYYLAYKIIVGKYSVFMPHELEQVADMIVLGYTKNEMCEILNCTLSQLEDSIEEIRDMYRTQYEGTLADEKIATV